MSPHPPDENQGKTVSVTFRLAEQADLPAILHLYAQPAMDAGHVLGLDDAARIFDRMAAYPNYTLHVATQSGSVVGSFALLIMDNLGHLGRPSAIIEDVVVDPHLQRQGIGRAMIQYALSLATRYGCYKAMLSSNLSRTEAHAFYESLGFTQHGHSYRIELEMPLAQPRADTCKDTG